MSAEERKKILQMVSDGKINAEEAANLMRALDEPAEEEIQIFESGPGIGGERSDSTEFDEVRRRARLWAWIPLSGGIILTTLFAWWMVNIQQNSGYNLWFFCLGIPLTLSIFLIVAGAGSAASRWLYVNVDRSHSSKDGPRKITVAFPLPLGLIAWFLKTFGQYIDGLKKTSVDEIVQAIALTKNITEPLVINVDETDEGGERVQVFIG